MVFLEDIWIHFFKSQPLIDKAEVTNHSNMSVAYKNVFLSHSPTNYVDCSSITLLLRTETGSYSFTFHWSNQLYGQACYEWVEESYSSHGEMPHITWQWTGIFLQGSEVAQSCPTLCKPMDCSLQRSSTHGIFQARVLEWVAISFLQGRRTLNNYSI